MSGVSNRSRRSVYNYALRPILRTGLRPVQLFLVRTLVQSTLKLGLSRKRTNGHYVSLRCQWRGKYWAAQEETTGALKQYIIETLRSTRLSYFGHVARMNSSRSTRCFMVILEAAAQGEDHGRMVGQCRRRLRDNTFLYPRPAVLLKKPDFGPRRWSCQSADLSTSPWH